MKPISLSKPFDRLLFVCTMLMIFTMAARAPVDTDMWWALRAGKETWVDNKEVGYHLVNIRSSSI